MRKSKFTESQIVGILGEGEVGLPVAEICRKHGISNATYYQWKWSCPNSPDTLTLSSRLIGFNDIGV